MPATWFLWGNLPAHPCDPPTPGKRMQVQEIARVQSAALPSLLKFRDADEQASTFRVAALTSAAFLRACAAQLAPPRGSSPTPPPSAPTADPSAPADLGIAVPGVTAAALAVLVRLIEGSPPAELTVDAACELTAAAHACGAEALLAVLPDYLTPLLHQASDKEVRLLPLLCMPHLEMPCSAISPPRCSSVCVCSRLEDPAAGIRAISQSTRMLTTSDTARSMRCAGRMDPRMQPPQHPWPPAPRLCGPLRRGDLPPPPGAL